eukprot:gene5155-5236_t
MGTRCQPGPSLAIPTRLAAAVAPRPPRPPRRPGSRPSMKTAAACCVLALLADACAGVILRGDHR